MPTVTIANNLFSYVSNTKSVAIPGCEIRSVEIESIVPEPLSYIPIGQPLRDEQVITQAESYFKLTVRTNYYNGSEAFSFDLRTPITDHPSWTNTLVGARFASDAIMSIAGAEACCGGRSDDDCLFNIIVNNNGVEEGRFDNFDPNGPDDLNIQITQA
jgi:hypothetical protein